jgi:tetratricopeptide (TPR) repeat protein
MTDIRSLPTACLTLLVLCFPGCSGSIEPYDPMVAGRELPDVLAALGAGEPDVALQALARHREQGSSVALDHYEAVAYIDAGQPAEALAALERELLAHPGNGTAFLLMAEALMDMGRVVEAPAQLEQATLYLTDTPYLALVSGRVALALDDDAAAGRHFRAYVADDPYSSRAAEAHHGLSQIARRSGDLDRAESERERSAYLEKVNQFLNAYRQRLGENPRDSEAALGVGMTYLDLHQHFLLESNLLELAEGAFEAVLGIEPDNVRALFNLGYILTVTERHDLAHARFAETLALEPEHVGALLNDGTLFLRQKQYELARPRLLAGLAGAQVPGALVRANLELGRLEEACEQLTLASVYYRAALTVDPNDPRLLGLSEHLLALESGGDG